MCGGIFGCHSNRDDREGNGGEGGKWGRGQGKERRGMGNVQHLMSRDQGYPMPVVLRTVPAEELCHSK